MGKIIKYKNLTTEIQRLWNKPAKVSAIVIGTLGAPTVELSKQPPKSELFDLSTFSLPTNSFAWSTYCMFYNMIIFE